LQGVQQRRCEVGHSAPLSVEAMNKCSNTPFPYMPSGYEQGKLDLQHHLFLKKIYNFIRYGTVDLTFKNCAYYICIGRAYHYPPDVAFFIYFSTNISTEYFKHAANNLFFLLKMPFIS
jgi:hypothetical protein